MQFEELVKMWEKILNNNNEGLKILNPSYNVRNEIEEGIYRTEVSGINYKVIVIQRGMLPRKGFYIPADQRSRSARMYAAIHIHPELSLDTIARALSTPYGVELLQTTPLSLLEGAILRPRLNTNGDLRNDDYTEWLHSVDPTKTFPVLSGPRNESVLRIILGNNWKELPEIA